MRTLLPRLAPAILVVVLLGAAAPPTALATSPEWDGPGGEGVVTLSGVVVDARTGEPLAAYDQAWTTGETWRAYNETKADGDGRFALTIRAGAGHLQATAVGGGHRAASESFDGEGDASFTIELEPHPEKTAILAGVVVDRQTGRPIQGASVSLAPRWSHGGGGVEPAIARDEPVAPRGWAEPCCDGGSSAITGADGRYRLSGYGGDHEVQVWHEGYANARATVSLVEAQTTTHDFELEPVPPMDAVVEGIVRDARTGRPVEGAHVTLSNLEWGAWNATTTDASGRFVLRTMPGYAELRVHAWREVTTMTMDAAASSDRAAPTAMVAPSGGADRNYYPWLGHVRLASGHQDVPIDLTPKPDPTQSVEGYVVDAATGRAIAGAWVSIRNEDTGEWGGATTDEDGSYRIMVRAGYLVVEAYAEGHFPRGTAFAMGDAKSVRLDLVLEAGEPRYGCCYAYAAGAAVADDGFRAPAAAESGKAGGGREPRTTAVPTVTGTYAGSGGGLGAMEGDPVTDPRVLEKDRHVVPGAGALLVVGALGAAVAIARRR